MRLSHLLDLNRGAIHEAASRFHTSNPRIFGSVLCGADHDASDIDLLVDALPGTTLFDLGGLQAELEDMLGVHVDLLSATGNVRTTAIKVASPSRTIDAVRTFPDTFK